MTQQLFKPSHSRGNQHVDRACMAFLRFPMCQLLTHISPGQGPQTEARHFTCLGCQPLSWPGHLDENLPTQWFTHLLRWESRPGHFGGMAIYWTRTPARRFTLLTFLLGDSPWRFQVEWAICAHTLAQSYAHGRKRVVFYVWFVGRDLGRGAFG